MKPYNRATCGDFQERETKAVFTEGGISVPSLCKLGEHAFFQKFTVEEGGVQWLVLHGALIPSPTQPLCPGHVPCPPRVCYWSPQIALINGTWPAFFICSSSGSLYTFFHFVCLLWSPLLAMGGLLDSGSPWAYQPTSRKSFGLRKDNE